jgi:peroxiredoxin
MTGLLLLTWAVLLPACWLGWQLLRQNGRLLLRLEELEKRLDHLEFGEGDEPAGLPVGSEAPAFELPDLSGNSKTLVEFRGQPLLLIFFNPACGFCRELAPKLAPHLLQGQAPSEGRAPRVPDIRPAQEGHGLVELGPPDEGRPRLLIVSTGSAEANRKLFDEHRLIRPVLLQKDSEVATAYQVNGTPGGYLIDREGKIASELAMGAEDLLALAAVKAESRNQKAEMGQGLGGPVDRNGDGRADRFKERSLVRSKIKRDGLKAGTPAPDFRLPRLDGRGDLGLEDLRGRRVLLVFSSPHCGPCNTLAPELEKFHRRCVTTADATRDEVGRAVPCAPQHAERSPNGALGTALPTLGTAVVMISRGEPKENRAKVKEYGLTFPIVLQQQWEVSRRYAMFATPIAYLIDEAGVITQDVAVGADAILNLMAGAGRWVHESEEVTHV